MMNMNDNTEGIEVEAPPVVYDGEDDAEDIEQLPIANDDYNEDGNDDAVNY